MPAETGILYSFGAVGDGHAAHVRGSRARSGALGSPRSARGGSGRSPGSTWPTATPRTCAARGRGVGPWGPRAAPAGVRGAAPARPGRRPRRARARLAGAEWGLGVPAQRPRGFGAQPRLDLADGHAAHVRGSRARSGALGSPRSARGGSGRSPGSTWPTATPRTCAARGRGVGPWGPRAAPAGVRGAAPARPGRWPRRARARLAGAEWGLGVPAQRPRGFGAQPRRVR